MTRLFSEFRTDGRVEEDAILNKIFLNKMLKRAINSTTRWGANNSL